MSNSYAQPTSTMMALKIWATGFVLGPILFLLEMFTRDILFKGYIVYNHAIEIILLWLGMTILGAVLSTPMLLLLWPWLRFQQSYLQQQYLQQSGWTSVLPVLLVSAILTILPLYLIFGVLPSVEDSENGGSSLYAILAYLLAVWLGVLWVFPPTIRQRPRQDEPLDDTL